MDTWDPQTPEDGPLICINGQLWFALELLAMSQFDEPGEHASKPKPSRLEEARRIIEEYAEDLREIIRKLRRRLQ